MKTRFIATGIGAFTGATGFMVDGNTITIIGAFVATVGLTLSVIGWVERKIDHKIAEHENAYHRKESV